MRSSRRIESVQYALFVQLLHDHIGEAIIISTRELIVYDDWTCIVFFFILVLDFQISSSRVSQAWPAVTLNYACL